jgi:hypothetical protein
MDLEQIKLIFKLAPKRYPEYEHTIFQDSDFVAEYIKSILSDAYAGKFADHGVLESIQFTNVPCMLYYYSLYVMKDRWPVAEPYMRQNYNVSYFYVQNVLKTYFWPTSEHTVRVDCDTSFHHKLIAYGIELE